MKRKRCELKIDRLWQHGPRAHARRQPCLKALKSLEKFLLDLISTENQKIVDLQKWSPIFTRTQNMKMSFPSTEDPPCGSANGFCKLVNFLAWQNLL
jgi:hypothetical protein